jgi:hypothetical protein
LTKSVANKHIFAASPFVKYLKRDSKHESISIEEAKEILFERMHTVNLESVGFFERINASKEDLRCVSRQIQEGRKIGADQMRNYLRFQIALHTHRLEFFEAEYTAMKDNVQRFAQFRDFLERNPAPGMGVDFRRFCGELKQVPSDTGRFDKEQARLKIQIQRMLKGPKPGGNAYAAFVDAETRTGQILVRLKREVSRVMFPDLELVARALLEAARDKPLFTWETVMDELFDIGWSVRQFPFAPPMVPFRIPSTSDIIPKVFAPDFIAEEWQFMPLGKLAGRDWPLKSATEKLFPVMILTNPFAIADCFYGVIEDIGKCVQRIFIRAGKETSFVEIDFDQMFVLMILCLLTSGLYDILGPMQYAYAFAEFVKTDPCRQYAMSHMEGLCAHLAQLDYQDLRKRSLQLLETYVSERDTDPLRGNTRL